MLVAEMIAALADLDDEDLDTLAEAVEAEQDDREEGGDMPDDLESDDGDEDDL